jgi:hypothetical protein
MPCLANVPLDGVRDLDKGKRHEGPFAIQILGQNAVMQTAPTVALDQLSTGAYNGPKGRE